MNELSIEEKAKRYDEAIEKLRSLHDDYDTVSTLIDVKEELENIFPELAESDDEKIRKGIIRNLEYLMDRAEGFVKDELKERIAWLEKIGERGTNGNNRKIPNSAWSEEDEENMMMIEDRLSDYLDYIREDTSLTKLNKNSMKEEIIEYVNWLKSLKERVQFQNRWKPSERQKEALLWCVVHLGGADKQTLGELLEELNKL